MWADGKLINNGFFTPLAIFILSCCFKSIISSLKIIKTNIAVAGIIPCWIGIFTPKPVPIKWFISRFSIWYSGEFKIQVVLIILWGKHPAGLFAVASRFLNNQGQNNQPVALNFRETGVDWAKFPFYSWAFFKLWF